MVNQTVMKIKGDISYGVEFRIPLKEGMSYIIDDGKYIKGIICDTEKYNKSYQTCRKHMKQILNIIMNIHYDYYDNEYKENERRIQEEEDLLGLLEVF